MVHLGLSQWTSKTNPRWENGWVEGCPAAAPICTMLSHNAAALLNFDWLESALKPPRNLCAFSPGLFGQNPKKTQKGTWLVLTSIFRPPCSLSLAMAAKFDLLETAYKSLWKLLQNVEFTLAIQLLTTRMALGQDQLLPKSPRISLGALCVVPLLRNANRWYAGSTSCKLQWKYLHYATSSVPGFPNKQWIPCWSSSPSACFLATQKYALPSLRWWLKYVAALDSMKLL